MTHLTYFQHPELVGFAYESLFNLIPFIMIQDSEEYFIRIETVLRNGILQNMKMNAGGNVEITKVHITFNPSIIVNSINQ